MKKMNWIPGKVYALVCNAGALASIHLGKTVMEGNEVTVIAGGDGSLPDINSIIGKLLGTQRPASINEIPGTYPLGYLRSFWNPDLEAEEDLENMPPSARNYEASISFRWEALEKVAEIVSAHYELEWAEQ